MWGDALRHELAVCRIDTRSRCSSCPKGSRRRITHHGCANGVALMSACEFHAYMWLRESRATQREARV